MVVFCNDHTHNFEEQTVSVHDFIKKMGYNETHGIALAVNKSIIPQSEWTNYQLKNHDEVLIIKATQGG